MESKNNIVNGKLWKSFLLYFFPIFLSALIQQSYSIVDAIIIGNFAGKDALAAIDAPLAYIRLLINTFIALSSGGAIIISQLYGKGDLNKIKKNISILLNFSILGGIFFTVIGFLLAPNFLNIMLVPNDIYELSLVYLKVYFLGTAFVFLFNIISGILQAIGDSKSSFIYLTISSILNIFLDIIFVGNLRMGTMGAAFATIISQAVATILIFFKLKKQKKLYFFKIFVEKKDLYFLNKIFKLGLPMAMQAIIFSVANIFMQREINNFGTTVIAGWSICGKSDFLIWNIADSLGVSVTTFVAQNYGARKLNRMKESVKLGLFLGIFLFTIFSSFLYIYIEILAKLFTRDRNTIEMTIFLMRIIAPFYTFYMFSEIFGGAIRGTGNTFYPMICSLIGICIFRLTWVFVAVPRNNTLKTVIIGYPISWILIAFLHSTYYIYYMRKLNNFKNAIS